jgi:DNA-3-methyladenine glycosylase
MLKQSFFIRDTLSVAQDLIGKEIHFNINSILQKAVITETEGYFGDDEASHGACGKTKRNEPMFQDGGYTYVYLIYGMYYCLNISTEKENFPAAILIRGIKIQGVDEKLTNGPGKLCKYIGINKDYNNLYICDENSKIKIYDIGYNPNIITTKRIGITKNTDKPWRFIINP